MRTARERTAPDDKKRFEVYHVTLCNVELAYTVSPERVVTLKGARSVLPVTFDDVGAAAAAAAKKRDSGSR